jgi:predicted restriction endonuclease
MTKYSKIGKSIKAERYGSSCVICGFSRFVEYCHIIPASKNGTIHPDNIIPLCPTHHTLMDRFLLNKEEEVTLEKFRTRATSSSYSIKIT